MPGRTRSRRALGGRRRSRAMTAPARKARRIGEAWLVFLQRRPCTELEDGVHGYLHELADDLTVALAACVSVEVVTPPVADRLDEQVHDIARDDEHDGLPLGRRLDGPE